MKQTTLIHLFILLAMLGFAVWAFVSAAPNVVLQLGIGIASAFAYVVWGIFHHAVLHDLHPKIVIEYILVGTIAIVLLMTILDF